MYVDVNSKSYDLAIEGVTEFSNNSENFIKLKIKVMLDDTPLERVHRSTEIFLDENMTWKNHIRIFLKILDWLVTEEKKLLYCTLVSACTNYDILI